jgi:ribosomal 30S subunit maturation factor RimM
VVTPDGLRRGRVRDVILLPQQHLYAVDTGFGEVLIPAVPAIVLSVDTAARRITVTDLPGLFDVAD